MRQGTFTEFGRWRGGEFTRYGARLEGRTVTPEDYRPGLRVRVASGALRGRVGTLELARPLDNDTWTVRWVRQDTPPTPARGLDLIEEG